MKRQVIVIFLFFTLGCSFFDDDKGKINWIEDYQQGIRLAGESGKPVMLFFTASWCGWCKRLKKDVFSDDNVARISEEFINIYVDVDKMRQISEQYNIRGVPTVFFLDSEGSIVLMYNGDRTAEDFFKNMNAVLKISKKL